MFPRLRWLTVLAAWSLSGGLALAQGQAEASWPGFQGGAAHLGQFSDARLRPPLRVLWRLSLPGDGRLSGVATNGNAGFAIASDAFVKFQIATGAIQWQIPRTRGPLIPPAVDPAGGRAGTGFFAEGSRQRDAAVSAVDLATRRRLWSANVGPVGFGGPTVAGGTIVVGTTTGSVVGIDGKSGRLLWTVRVEGPVNTAPAAAGERVFAVSENRQDGRARLYALRADGCGSPSCRPLWSFSPPGIASGTSAPTVEGSTVYVGFGDTGVRALDAATGRVRWTGHSRRLFSPRSSPAVEGNELYVVDAGGGTYRFDARSGRRLWDYQFPSTATSGAPLVVPGRPSTVFVGLDDGTVAAIQANNGHLRWRTQVGSAPIAPFAAATSETGAVLVAPAVARRGGIHALVHDPRGRLIDLESPTVLDFAAALRNFAVAFVALTALLLAFFRFLPRRQVETTKPTTG